MTAYYKNEICLICGGGNIYSKSAVRTQCMFCGEPFYVNLICENGHYVCDDCHLERSLAEITDICMKNKQKEAVGIAFELMMNKWVRANGPEHPFLVAATLLTAYKNRGYGTEPFTRNFSKLLEEAQSRTLKIPENSSSFWGCAGEAIACGIFAGLILNTTQMSTVEFRFANAITAEALGQIAEYGGPRCSKRESLIAIIEASQFTDKNWHMPLTDFAGAECKFFNANPDCTGSKCPFYPEQAA
ncbi:MAG: DUF5714 domain-containing protein [Clostridiales bacterium]|nr:DUF5714 domain-containing protein [Clostridiales bacterium]